MKERYSKNIPSAEEFISRLKTKYNGVEKREVDRSVNEIDVMTDWIKEHRNKRCERPEHANVDVDYNPEEPYMDYNPLFTKYYYLGISSYESGHFKESVEFFGKALKINPNHKVALRYLLKAFYYVKENGKIN